MDENKIDIPVEWQALPVERWRRPVLIVGAPSSGKSTFARYLYGRLLGHHDRLAYLDADVGQKDLGPPSVVSLGLRSGPAETAFPPAGPQRMYFIGANSPRGQMLPIILGVHRLHRFANSQGVQTLVVDSSGLVEPALGGASLKWAKVELLRPCTVVAFQQQRELAPILGPLRRLPGVMVYELPPPPVARPRSTEERRAQRAGRYRAYFQNAQRRPLAYGRLAIFPDRRFEPGRLLALEDRAGFVESLAVVDQVDTTRNVVWLHTPHPLPERIASLRLGDLRLDLATFQDEPLGWPLAADHRPPAADH